MLYLTFRHGESLYGIDTRGVTEVVPLVGVRPLPLAPAYLRGLLSYREAVVPVVDFSAVVGTGLSRAALSTRIILVAFSSGAQARTIGLIAEHVDRVVRGDEVTTMMPGMNLPDAPYLGGVVRFGDVLIQLVKPEFLIPERLLQGLFADPAEAERCP